MTDISEKERAVELLDDKYRPRCTNCNEILDGIYEERSELVDVIVEYKWNERKQAYMVDEYHNLNVVDSTYEGVKCPYCDKEIKLTDELKELMW